MLKIDYEPKKILKRLNRDDFKTPGSEIELIISDNLFTSPALNYLTEEEEEILPKLNSDFVTSIKILIHNKKSVHMSRKFFFLMQHIEYKEASCSLTNNYSITRYAFIAFSNVRVLTLNIYNYQHQVKWLLRHGTNIKEIIFEFLILDENCFRYLLEEDIANKNLRITFKEIENNSFGKIVRYLGAIHPNVRKYVKVIEFAVRGRVSDMETYKRFMYFVTDPSSSCIVRFDKTILSCDRSIFIVPIL